MTGHILYSELHLIVKEMKKVEDQSFVLKKQQ